MVEKHEDPRMARCSTCGEVLDGQEFCSGCEWRLRHGSIDSNGRGMRRYRLVWSPTGQEIGYVHARTKRAAVRKAPAPYRRYLGEIYAEEA